MRTIEQIIDDEFGALNALLIDGVPYWVHTREPLSTEDIQLAIVHDYIRQLFDTKYGCYDEFQPDENILVWDTVGSPYPRDGSWINCTVQLPDGRAVRFSPCYVCGTFSSGDTEWGDTIIYDSVHDLPHDH